MPRRPNDRPLRVLVGICGGIAAYKMPDLARALRKKGCEVKTAVTASARSLVGEEALRTVSGNAVYSDTAPSAYDMDHIRLAEWADVLLVCPATANTIAKLAHGIADNLLTTLALSFEGRIIVAPAMNSAMWRKAATRENVAVLDGRGIDVLPVDDGALACGTSGPGRMLPVDAIVQRVLAGRVPALLSNGRVLIASGPTVEPIDPVRVITNRSSGKMGAALAAEAAAMGAKVTVVTGPGSAPLPAGVECIPVTTAREMAAALDKNFDRAHIVIMAAAISDFKVKKASRSKLKRKESGAATLDLEANPDILAGLGKKKRGRFLVGFALEDRADTRRAREKMRAKKCDMMVMNTVRASLGTDTSAVTILTPEGAPAKIRTMDKRAIAREILTRVARASGAKHA
ncbi:MAG: bifunctional phosphopantothenoylcysteine decarboxylase/phosphopantothenate--cysteine ligase CoaBC [Chitinivibrionales bacterium]|nr:bifunctional phosphopantothenoylcysteine decarboxylase/phosphopantothenate--cysteine ligase CoaBC [Chitinivibrionales bacterium]MBD3396785.1 bifunctional phosphopantothenoylcysteine decarboxylase/phosphopantothenate--cysteine ligase CoaBC [Chitinivibrionales bacterium]